jgi:hypothetical protein
VTRRADLVEIFPEPTPDEREAILAALPDAAGGERHPARGTWGRPPLDEDDDER